MSHSLAFIMGTLVLQRGDAGFGLPNGKILIPVSKVGRLETDGRPWKETQIVTVVQKKDEEWCRAMEDELKLWKAPGRNGDLYLLWPAGSGLAPRLQQLVQRKLMLTADGKNFGFCGREEGNSGVARGVQYD